CVAAYLPLSGYAAGWAYLPSLPRIWPASRWASRFPTKSGFLGLRTPHRLYRRPCEVFVGTSEYDPVPNTMTITGVFFEAIPGDCPGKKGVRFDVTLHQQRQDGVADGRPDGPVPARGQFLRSAGD